MKGDSNMAVLEISFFSDGLADRPYDLVPIERPHHYGGSSKPASEPFRPYICHGYSGCNTDGYGSRIEQGGS